MSPIVVDSCHSTSVVFPDFVDSDGGFFVGIFFFLMVYQNGLIVLDKVDLFDPWGRWWRRGWPYDPDAFYSFEAMYPVVASYFARSWRS